MRTSNRFPIAALLLLGAMSLDTTASSGGYPARTLKSSATLGCGGCHGASADPNLSVAITGPTALNRGQAGTFTVTANKIVADGTAMGMDVAADDVGSLSAVAMTPTTVNGGEVTHTNGSFPLKRTTGNTASYQFVYTMPALAAQAAVGSSHTLYAIGMVAGWSHAPNFIVRTRPLAPTSVTPSNVTAGTVDLTWSGGGPEYQVVFKAGATAPVDENDGTFAYQGAGTTTTVSPLDSSTQYSFAVFSKLSGAGIYSTSAATAMATTGPSTAVPRYVNAVTGSNPSNNCLSAGSPCKTITYAMTQAVGGTPGDAINVAPGTYNQALGEVFPIVVKSGVQLQSTVASPNATAIDATGANARVFNANGANAFSRIEGFLISGGLHQPPANGSNAQGGAILIDNLSRIRIRRNLFIDNEARGYDGTGVSFVSGGIAYGGALFSSNSSPVIENNLFFSNTVQGGTGLSKSDGTAASSGGNAHGGAVWIGGGAAVVINNSFVANDARGGAGGSSNTSFGGPGGSAFNGAADTLGAIVANNLFVGNAAIAGTGGSGSPAGAPGNRLAGALTSNSSPSTTNNLFFNNSGITNGDTLGTNAVQADPQFHSASDYRIRLSSPARAAGTSTGAPAIDYYSVARPSPPTIGAFEATGFVSSTALASSVNPSSSGQAVTFTATVTSTAGTPTGTVTFKDGAATICNAVAVGGTGQAQCPTFSLSVATHSITAEYSGGGNFAASTSTVLSQVVNSDFASIPRLGNISTRGQVLTGNDVMIGGFVIGGSANKTVVVRARGPSLIPFGITNALINPHLQLQRSSDAAVLVINDDWGSASNAAAISASGFAPSNALESAILVNLPPGAYTAIVSGVGGGTGVAIIEVFELDHPEVPLANISTRGRVFTGNDVMIGGFVIQGSAPQTVIIRARGPSLIPFGITNALMNPHLQLQRSSDGAVLAINDDWGSAPNSSAIASSGFAPSDSRESAILMSLPPGAYTAIVSGVGGTNGVAIVEVFAQ